MTPDELSERLLSLSVRIGRVIDALPESRLGRHVAQQLVRCGTSAGPNYEEGRAAESKKDFQHKLRIALKELRETWWWLKLIVRSELLPEERLNDVIDECGQLVRILTKSVFTAAANPQRATDDRQIRNTK